MADERPEPESRRQNRLIREKSPYLLQHAYNPVDWYPWSDEAFARAAGEDRPVFLSIGYSACHWCHVMERESFEDLDIARLLNDAFVCIKVDREERPDIDQLYMTAAQSMIGTGGWPLTIIMTPDRLPFYAATYIPKESRFGTPGLLDIVPRITALWKERRGDAITAGRELADFLKSAQARPGNEPGVELLHSTYEALALSFDSVNGGFGSAPKFPAPHTLMFLLRYWKRTGKGNALALATRTLDAIAMGGIHDHIGGGFHRYSTDARWLVPHFEKMLYDQALLALAYTEAFLATANPWYREIAEETLRYVQRQMTSPEGGFYSAEDADSEGEEGRYYLWTRDEILAALGHEEGEFASGMFRVAEAGNFREPGTGRRTGKNILHLAEPPEVSGRRAGSKAQEISGRLRRACEKLAEVRGRRIPPLLDDKILTDWNGLMVVAFARAARAFGDADYALAAGRAAEFLLTRMRSPEGTLLHRYRGGSAGIPALATDYAFLVWGLIELYQASFTPGWLREAIGIQREFSELCLDTEYGGYFTAPEKTVDLIARQKDFHDWAFPSANAVACRNLLCLARMTGNPAYGQEAARIGRLFASAAGRSPATCAFFQTALDLALGPSWEIVIAGDPALPGTDSMIRLLNGRFLPSTLILVRIPGKRGEELDRLTGFTGTLLPDDRDTPMAYLCSGIACSLKTTDIRTMLARMGEGDCPAGST